MSDASNPKSVTPFIFTIVTTVLEESISFYSSVLGYSVVDQGTLGRLPTGAPGVPAGGRYVLMRALYDAVGTDRGLVRLLEAPVGTPPVRPREARNTDTGLVRFQARAVDADLAYAHATSAGFPPIAKPIEYQAMASHLADGSPNPRFSRSFAILGPNHERLNITTSFDSVTGINLNVLQHEGNIGAINAGVIYCRDRWPVLGFYKTVFGIDITWEIPLYNERVNMLVGDPPGTQLFTGYLGNNFVEWKETRQYRPLMSAPYPQRLDRTGFAMTTALVDDLQTVRQNCSKAGIPLIGEGCLPCGVADDGDRGFYVQGAVGELYEIIQRR